MAIATELSLSTRLWFVSWRAWGYIVIPALRLLRDGLYRLWSKAPPTASTFRIQPQWLQSILQKRIHSIDILPFDENRGFVGSMRRVRVTFQKDDSTNSPLSLILKTSTRHSGGGLSLGPMREARFYRYYKHQRDPSLPKVYYASANPYLWEAVVLLQDLQCDNYINVNHILGNQIWGTPISTKDATKLKVIGTMYRAAADWHAGYWNDPTLLEKGWMRNSNWWFGKDRHYWELSMKASYDGWCALKRYDALVFPPGFCEMMDQSYEQSSFDHTRRFLQQTTFTLSHGDFHAANMMMHQQYDNLKLLDWSEVGPWEPTTDLAQTIISDVPAKLFPHVLNILRKDYYDRLIQHNETIEFAWEDCRRRFGESGMERWIWVLGVMGLFSCPETLYQYFINQMEAFRKEFCPDQDSFYLTTCGYVLPRSLA